MAIISFVVQSSLVFVYTETGRCHGSSGKKLTNYLSNNQLEWCPNSSRHWTSWDYPLITIHLTKSQIHPFLNIGTCDIRVSVYKRTRHYSLVYWATYKISIKSSVHTTNERHTIIITEPWLKEAIDGKVSLLWPCNNRTSYFFSYRVINLLIIKKNKLIWCWITQKNYKFHVRIFY